MKVWYALPALAVAVLAGQALDTALAGPGEPNPPLKEFSVTARRFAFDPAHLEVEQGDHVKITLTTSDGTHGFAIEQLDVREPIRRGSGPVVVEFDADEPGTFEISCSEYCGSGHKKMKGVLVVHPR